eukprot:TRINITY_DN47341_c0_g1_i1.p1 TRINITY_DN47341_c0_g1~~TRINITY_DN47341_c0_g1_i1.p1  ORF type:complete len:283 (-),score=16.02 TRINITY_DN47341_c0_g1_i1:238-1086(-)
MMATPDTGDYDRDYDRLCNLTMVGDRCVGKTAMSTRWAHNTFGSLRRAQNDFESRTLSVAGRLVRVQLWDIGFRGFHRPILRAFCRGADGIMICYDVGNRESFERVADWRSEVYRHCRKGTPVILVGCKSDLQEPHRRLSYEEGQARANDMGVPFIETSARTGGNVEAAAELLLGMVLAADNPMILTLASVTMQGSCDAVEVVLSTLGGDVFKVTVDAEEASVAGAIACISKAHNVSKVQLLSQDGEVLSPGQRLPGLPVSVSKCAGLLSLLQRARDVLLPI